MDVSQWSDSQIECELDMAKLDAHDAEDVEERYLALSMIKSLLVERQVRILGLR